MKEILITSSVLILILAALRYALRGRISLRLQYALWLLIALRLLVPIQFGQFQFSVSNLASRSDTFQQIQHRQLVGPSYEEAIEQVKAEYNGAANALPEAALEQAAQSRMTGPTVGQLLQGIWLFGMAAMGLWFAAVNFTFGRRARRNAQSVAINGCPIPVFVSPDIPSPCLVGFFQPRIYLTPASLENSSRLRHVLSHELTHWRHKETWWSVLRCVCLCVYWFNPLVWWAAVLSRRDCELACDEGALTRLGESERFAYGRTLLDMVAQTVTPAAFLQTATTMIENKKQLKERVCLIVKKPKTVAATILCLTLVLTLAVGCAFSGPVDSEKSNPSTSDAVTDAPTEPTASQPTNPPAASTLNIGTKAVPADFKVQMPESLDSDREDYLISIDTSDFEKGVKQGNNLTVSAFFHGENCGADDTIFGMELYEGEIEWLEYPTDSSRRVERQLYYFQSGTQSGNVEFNINTENLSTGTYAVRFLICKADGTLLARHGYQISVEPNEVPLQSLQVRGLDGDLVLSEVSKLVGEPFQCYVEFTPGNYTGLRDVKVTISDPSVVEVSLEESNLYTVRAIGVGDATITFTCEGVSTNVAVHVEEVPEEG